MDIAMRNMLLLLLDNLKDIICGHVRIFVTLSIIFWTVDLLELALNCKDKLYVSLWLLIVLILLQIFCPLMYVKGSY